EDLLQVKRALVALMGSKTRVQRDAAFDRYESELLSPSADELLEEFAVGFDPSLRETIRQYQRLLAIARSAGIGTALALYEWQSAGLRATPGYMRAQEILRVVWGMGDSKDYERGAEHAREGLELVDRQAHPEVWAAIQLGLAEALLHMKGVAWHAH